MLTGRFQKFSKGRASDEAALSDHNEERGAFRVWGVLNSCQHFEKLRKEVNEIMGGQVLDYETKRARREGRAEGQAEGRAEGRKVWRKV